MTAAATGGGVADLLAGASGSGRDELAALLLGYARTRRWFRSKSRTPRSARVLDLLPIPGRGGPADTVVAILEITYQGGDDDLYVIPLAAAPEENGRGDGAEAAARARIGALGTTTLADGLALGSAASALFGIVREGRLLPGEAGELFGESAALLPQLLGSFDETTLPTKVHHAEQTNSTITLGDRALLKIYRQLTPTPSPELEVGRFLSELRERPSVPRVLGALSYRRRDGREYSLGIAHELLANDGDAWSVTLRELGEFFDRVAGRPLPSSDTAAAAGRFVALAGTLGRRTGELHLALADGGNDPDFVPEPLSVADRKALAARAGEMLTANLATLATSRDRLGPEARRLADQLLGPDARAKVTGLLSAFRDCPLETVKIRIHGDLHLGQVLCRGDDFFIIDFEGEPSRPLAERRAKGSPVRDVMGMARSFDYAPEAALRERARRTGSEAHDGASDPALVGWARLWKREVIAAFSKSYLATVRDAPFVPKTSEELARLFTFYELERVIYEIGYELDNRPDWAEIPLRGLAALVRGEGEARP